MSNRVRHRQRHGKGAVTNRSSHTNPPVVPPVEVSNSSSEVPFYNVSQPITQANQNNWSHPPLSNPTFYSQNSTVPEQPAQGYGGYPYYWSGNQYDTSVVQPTPVPDSRNWNTENGTSNFNHYNSFPPAAQEIQQPPWQVNQESSIFQPEPIQSNTSIYQEPSSQTLPNDPLVHSNTPVFQTTNSNPNAIASDATLQTWENTPAFVSQPEPWTYGYPQHNYPPYSNSSEASSSIVANTWTGNDDYPAFVENNTSAVMDNQLSHQTLDNNLHLQGDNLSIVGNQISESLTNDFYAGAQSGNMGANQVVASQQLQSFHCDTVESEMAALNMDSNVNDLGESAGNDQSGTLSAFFQNDYQVGTKSDPDQTYMQDTNNGVLASSTLNTMTEQISVSETNSHVSDSDVSEICPEVKNQESSFIQKENSPTLESESKLKSSSISPIQFVEEPVNKEIPESPINDVDIAKETALLQPFTNQTESEQNVIEEPPNQQVPVELEHIACSPSVEKERLIIQPREESPFKPPPRQSVLPTGSIPQQQMSLVLEANLSNEKTVVQEVNLETLPDNLERPPDYEELRKQSPFYSSHSRHLRQEVNSSPSSLLSENINIPCVTLAPAAPPLHPLVKSEFSNDCKLDGAGYSDFKDSIVHPISDSVVQENQVPSDAILKNNSVPFLNSTFPDAKNVNSVNTGANTSFVNKQDTDELRPENKIQQLEDPSKKYVALKDSKIESACYADGRNSAPIRGYEHSSEVDMKESVHPYNTNHGSVDPRYSEHTTELARQRFSDQKYSQSDDRSFAKQSDPQFPRPDEHNFSRSEDNGFSRFPSEKGLARPSDERSFSRPDERSFARATDERSFGKPSDERSFSRPDERNLSRPNERHFSRHTDEKVFSRPDERNFSRPDERIFSRPDERGFSRPDERSFSRPDERSFSRPDERSFSRPDERSFSRPDERSFSRPDERSFSRPDERSFSRPDERSFSRPDERIFSRPDERSFSRPDERSFSRPDERSFSRPDERSFSRPDERSFSRPDERSFSRPGMDMSFSRPSDDRGYYRPEERSYSRPSSRASSVERDKLYRAGEDPNSQHARDFERSQLRSRDSDVRHDKNTPYGSGYYPNQPAYPGYPRQNEYSQRPANYQGYTYDPYRQDPYYAYYDAYRYYSNYNYGFYDELYRNDPRYKQYREAQEQYRQYYSKYGGYGTDYDRSSVHSGRSSTNELLKEIPPSQYPEPDIDSNESEYSLYNQQYYQYGDVPNETSSLEVIDKTSTPSARLTPVKFSYAHSIARFSSGGMLVTVIPSQCGMTAAAPVQIHNLQAFMENEESFAELKDYQGPLTRGSTHKNEVIEFCTRKIKHFKEKKDIVDRESYILLWELMILLLRQNGSVVGYDIAELLLRDHEVLRPQPISRPVAETAQGEHSPAEINDSPNQSHTGDTPSPDEGIFVVHDKTVINDCLVDPDKITRKFREQLLFGHKKDALEWAMKNNLWGHALFLASKMELRTYANVMTRFANSLALNDPLQTLYQLMSGRQPSSMTFVADKKWGDWRPHLAMILSNPSSHPDVDSRSITTLGDTLASRGCLAAAHFCYIMAQVEFGTFEQKNSKLVLISGNHLESFNEFATNEAIQCTEVYEYAQSLANPGFMLIHLQYYKFIYAMRLLEHGLLEESLHYCEIISENFQLHPGLFSFDLVSEVLKVSTQLKYHDPHFVRGDGELQDQSDPTWLQNLTLFVQNFNNLMQEEIQTPPQNQDPIHNTTGTTEEYNSPSNDSTTYQTVSNAAIQNESYASTSNQMKTYYQPTEWGQHNNVEYATPMPVNTQEGSYYQGDMSLNQNTYQRENNAPTSHEENETTDIPSSPVAQTPPFDYYSSSMQQQVHDGRPSIQESVNSFSSSTANHRERRDSSMSTGSRYSSGSISVANKASAKENVKPDAKKEKLNSQVGKTWLGGIFSRLLPKAPNQMILPDDKNPTIVWDSTKNCWVNKDSNDDDEINAPAAPPTDMELMGTRNSVERHPVGVPSPPSMSSINKFQRPKTRAMRQNYVDILNSGNTSNSNSNIPAEVLFPSPQIQSNAPQMFMPLTENSMTENSQDFASVNQTSLTNQPILEAVEQPQVQEAAPLMWDPAEFDSRKSNFGTQRTHGTIGRVGRRTYPS